MYDFYLGNRNCAEILGPIALVEMESTPGKVIDRFLGLETGLLAGNSQPDWKVGGKSGIWNPENHFFHSCGPCGRQLDGRGFPADAES